MPLSSFSLQSSLTLSDPHWGAQVYSIFVYSGWFGVCALAQKLGEDPGYGVWDWKLVTQSSNGVRMGKY